MLGSCRVIVLDALVPIIGGSVSIEGAIVVEACCGDGAGSLREGLQALLEVLVPEVIRAV